MAGRRYAVLIGNSRFPEEPLLDDLRLPEGDVDGLSAILGSEARGEFNDVAVLKNRASFEVLRSVNRVLRRADKDDLVLIYYSGHGKQNRQGQLHLATLDTEVDLLGSTSVAVQQIKSCIDDSPSTRVILMLDCCYSGAAGDIFLRGGADDELNRMAGGRGIYIMTASTGIQMAVEKEGDRYGVFTRQVIEGIEGGEADANGDGHITMDEIYEYVRRNIRAEGAQEPMKWDLNVSGGHLIISKSGRSRREERRDRIRDRVFDLGRQGLLHREIVTRALEILDTPPDQLTEEMRRYDSVLDHLIAPETRIGDFMHQWYMVTVQAPAIQGPTRFRADAWNLPDEPLLGFVEVPAGPFLIGSDKGRDSQAYDDELPQHEMTLPGFYIARYPVTVAQFQAFLEHGDYHRQSSDSLGEEPDHPVVNVTWHDTLAYCRWLGDRLRGWEGTPEPLATLLRQEGRRVTLPSEAEWEKAARGTDGRIYPWGDEYDPGWANGEEARIGGTSAVGAFPSGASPYGCLDMAGNVWEWTRSLDVAYPYDPNDGREDLDATDGELRVVRGGSFRRNRQYRRCACRGRDFPNFRGDLIGFRVVVAIP